MEFHHMTEDQIRQELNNNELFRNNNLNVQDVLDKLEFLAREQGCTTGRLKDYSFVVEIGMSGEGTFVKTNCRIL